MFGIIPRLPLSLLLCLSVATLGCGPSTKKEKLADVSGTVSYLDGKPLKTGKISFENPTKGRVGGGVIKDGKFTLKAPVGEMVVRVTAIEEFGKPDSTGVRPSRQLISPKYNSNSVLKEIVTEGGPNNFKIKVGGARRR